MNRDILLSVIIPVYGTEKYLKKCLDSVAGQSYKNLEIIVVNDCSPDNSKKIIEEYMEMDTRIKCISLESNSGLYHARLAGFDASKGDYIVFLDSDDYVSIDSYRVMLEKAEEKDADMVFGKIVIDWDADGKQETHIYNEPYFDTLEGDVIFKSYLGQRGYTFYWYAIWNKLIKRELFLKSRNHYDRISEHTVMAEDVAFCTVLMAYAKRITTVNYYTNHYLQSSSSSTSRNGESEKYLKNIDDMCRVMDFIGDFITSMHDNGMFLNEFRTFREVFILYWQTSIKSSLMGPLQKKKCLAHLLNRSGIEKFPDHERNGSRDLTYGVDRSFIYCQAAPFNGRYEEIIKALCSDDMSGIIFSSIDILLNRNYTDASSLSWFILSEFKRSIPENGHEYFLIREECIREKMDELGHMPSVQEIYSAMSGKLPIETCTILQNAEECILMSLYTKRISTSQLISLARYLGKDIIVHYDSYPGRDFIDTILKKNGVEHTEENDDSKKYIYLDNEETIVPGHFAYPSSFDAMIDKCNLFDLLDRSTAFKDTYMKTEFMKACLVSVANIYFDNPFRPFDEKTVFNKDSYLIGLLPVGVFLDGVCRWLGDYTDFEKAAFSDPSTSMLNECFETYCEATPCRNFEAYITLSSSRNGKPGTLLSVYGSGDSVHSLYLTTHGKAMDIIKYLIGGIERKSGFYSESLIYNRLSNGVSDMTRYLTKTFGVLLHFMDYDPIALEAPLVHLIYGQPMIDRRLFDYCSIFTDSKNESEEKSLFLHWLEVISSNEGHDEIADKYYPFLKNRSIIHKALFFMLFDRNTLADKLLIRIGTRKSLTAIVKFLIKYIIKPGKGQDKK